MDFRLGLLVLILIRVLGVNLWHNIDQLINHIYGGHNKYQYLLLGLLSMCDIAIKSKNDNFQASVKQQLKA